MMNIVETALEGGPMWQKQLWESFFSFLYREAGEFRVASCRVDKVKENGGVRKETAAVGAIAMGEASSSTQRLSDPGLSLTGLELLRATPGPGFHGLLGEVSALVR